MFLLNSRNAHQFVLLSCALSALLFGTAVVRAQDQVTLTNNSGNPIGLLVDGKLGKSVVNDQTYVSNASPAVIGQFSLTPGNKSNEVMAFTQDRPMAIRSSVPWTSGNDNISVPFANKILIPVTVWVVYGDYATVQAKAANDLMTTSTIYSAERVGVDFSTVTFRDATANPAASNYYDLNSDQSYCAPMARDIGFDPGQINIYYVRTLISSGVQYTNAGQASRLPDGSRPMVIIASNTITTVLPHEIGHLCALYHVHSGAAPAQWFDSTNLMTTYGTLNQRFLTEGQVLRMHLSSYSSLNETYHARAGQPIRDCDPTSTTATDICPGVQKRIWADGTYPAN